MRIDERDYVLRLFVSVAEGRLEDVFAELWQRGYG
jgi:hypothetical protein